MARRPVNAADRIEELAARRESQMFISAGPARPARARARAEGAKADLPAPPALQPQRIASNYMLDEAHIDALRSDAMARLQKKLARRVDISAALRDVLDYWLAHREEVETWIASRYGQHPGRR